MGFTRNGLPRRALKEADRYLSYRHTRDQVEKAYEDLVVFDNLVVLAERVTTLVQCSFGIE